MKSCSSVPAFALLLQSRCLVLLLLITCSCVGLFPVEEELQVIEPAAAKDPFVSEALTGKSPEPDSESQDLFSAMGSPASPIEFGVGSLDWEAPELDGGFCADDIYGLYLRERYRQSEVGSRLGKVAGNRRRRAQLRRRLNLEGLNFARKVIEGETVPYYGGIPVEVTPEVEFWIKYFKTRGKRTFLKWLLRGESMRELVAPILAYYGLPDELFFLAMVESGFNNRAYSRARATGCWQFMAGTARLYGLKIDHWIDERRDPVKATHAAARYLRDLYAEFGNWYLAMAAYNAGPGKVKRAIRKTQSRDFWHLSKSPFLRPETKNYVPKVLAAVVLANNLREHGFDLAVDRLDPFPGSTIEVTRPINLQEVSRKMGVSLAELKRWNPELIRNIIPPRTAPVGSSYALRLKEELLPKFREIEPTLTFLEIKSFKMHTVRRGDTLFAIARRYGVSTRNILAVNPKLSPRRLRIGRPIAVPVPSIVEVEQRPKEQEGQS